MNELKADVATVGAGTAGLAAWRAARSCGKRVVLIEGGHYGTTCACVGCMPSKLLIAAAEAAHTVGATFGVGALGNALHCRCVSNDLTEGRKPDFTQKNRAENHAQRST